MSRSTSSWAVGKAGSEGGLAEVFSGFERDHMRISPVTA
jgi:hypothetical protein